MEVTLIKSAIAQRAKVKATLKALGLRRIGRTVKVDEKNAAHMGMVRTVAHCINVSGDKSLVNKSKLQKKVN